MGSTALYIAAFAAGLDSVPHMMQINNKAILTQTEKKMNNALKTRTETNLTKQYKQKQKQNQSIQTYHHYTKFLSL